MKIKYILPLASLVFLTSCSVKSNDDFTTLDNSNADTIIDIIEINDLHGYVNKASDSENYDLSNISYYINEKRAKKNNEVVLIGNGDMFEGTAFSNLSQGLSTVKVMNEMGFDMMGIGNHEYSWGLDTILNYFDGNQDNGEANFPLINGNVYKENQRYSEEDKNDIILPYTIVKKGDFKVGILSYIGDIASSISQTKLVDYKIKASLSFFKRQVYDDAKALKEEGCDFIIFNVHGGDTRGLSNYNVNQAICNLKDEESNKYLIDAIINGHTHSKQSEYITREDGYRLPLVQGGCYGNSFGEIQLAINSKEKKITKTKTEVIYVNNLNKNNKEENTKNRIDLEFSKIETILKKTYGNNPYNLSRAALGNLLAKEMRIATSADVSIMNTGGIRTDLDKGVISFEKIYEVYPFENHIICLKALGSELNDWVETQSSYYYMDYTIDPGYDKPFDDDKTYNVVTIDYVYDSTYFASTFHNYTFVSSSNITTPRDYFVSDLENRNEETFNINGQIKVTVKPFGELD